MEDNAPTESPLEKLFPQLKEPHSPPLEQHFDGWRYFVLYTVNFVGFWGLGIKAFWH